MILKGPRFALISFPAAARGSVSGDAFYGFFFFHLNIMMTVGGASTFGRVSQTLTDPKFVEEAKKAVRKIKNSKLFKDPGLMDSEVVPGWILCATLGGF